MCRETAASSASFRRRGKEAAARQRLRKEVRRLFGYCRPLAESEAPRGVMGIPRVLNGYDDDPFWFTLLTELGFSVRLSSESPDENLGIDTIPSQTLCSRGGRNIYGFSLGIRMLDTDFPRIPDDIGNSLTWDFPVLYKVVKGASVQRAVSGGDPNAAAVPLLTEHGN